LSICPSLIPGDNYKIRLSSHARRRMEERGVTLADIVEALKEPVQVFYDGIRDTYLVLGANDVAVVVAVRGTLVEVVTVLRRREYEALTGRLGWRRYRLIC
jgi:hypothetical protein